MEKGSFSLEASIVVSMILIFIVVILSFMINFLYLGSYEMFFNSDLLKKDLKNEAHGKLKSKEISFEKLEKIEIYQKTYKKDFKKSLIIEKNLKNIKEDLSGE